MCISSIVFFWFIIFFWIQGRLRKNFIVRFVEKLHNELTYIYLFLQMSYRLVLDIKWKNKIELNLQISS